LSPYTTLFRSTGCSLTTGTTRRRDRPQTVSVLLACPFPVCLSLLFFCSDILRSTEHYFPSAPVFSGTYGFLLFFLFILDSPFLSSDIIIILSCFLLYE